MLLTTIRFSLLDDDAIKIEQHPPQTSCFNVLLDLASSNQEDGTVGLKQLPGGQQEWDKVNESLIC